MRQREARAVGNFLAGFDQKVCTHCPVRAENDRHDDDHSHMLRQKTRQREHDQPVSRRRLLHLHMAGCKQRTELCHLVETDEQDVDDESDQQQDHRVAEALSEHFLHACRHRILSEVRVNHHGVDMEYIFQPHQDRTEI